MKIQSDILTVITHNQASPGLSLSCTLFSTGCNCSRDGSLSLICDELHGQCTCRGGYQSRTCDMCAEGFYNYPNCEECNCNPAGVIDVPGEPLGGCGQATQVQDRLSSKFADLIQLLYTDILLMGPLKS